MKNRHYIFFLIVFGSFTVHSNTIFDVGLNAANKKDYHKAIQSFEQVIKEEMANESAYFNLGNCYYETKQYGKAIWAYERVLKLSPRDSEAPKSIELCYKKLNSEIRWTPHTNGLQRLIYGVGSNKWACLAIVVSFFIGLSIFLYFKTKNNSWKRLNFFILVGETILLIAFTIASSSSSVYASTERFAIVTQKIIPTFMNDVGEKAELQLLEGTKVELLNPTKTKTEVMLEDGRKVLVSGKDVEGI